MCLAAVESFGNSVQQMLVEAILWDYGLLGHAALVEGWTDERPVSQQFFGPLWPYGVPADWPREVPSGDAELVIEIHVPDGATDDDVINVVKELADKIDSLDRAYCGRGVKVSSLEVCEEVSVPEGVSQ